MSTPITFCCIFFKEHGCIIQHTVAMCDRPHTVYDVYKGKTAPPTVTSFQLQQDITRLMLLLTHCCISTRADDTVYTIMCKNIHLFLNYLLKI